MPCTESGDWARLPFHPDERDERIEKNQRTPALERPARQMAHCNDYSLFQKNDCANRESASKQASKQANKTEAPTALMPNRKHRSAVTIPVCRARAQRT
jgi:hypothetical protein